VKGLILTSVGDLLLSIHPTCSSVLLTSSEPMLHHDVMRRLPGAKMLLRLERRRNSVSQGGVELEIGTDLSGTAGTSRDTAMSLHEAWEALQCLGLLDFQSVPRGATFIGAQSSALY
jgi:hypothetical protein